MEPASDTDDLATHPRGAHLTRPIVHAITPGDHFSPRTGSAIPTVVHGIAGAAAAQGSQRHRVLLDETTFQPRYDTADLIEYRSAPLPGLATRASDVLAARLGLPRRGAVRAFQPLADALEGGEPSFVLAHNAPALPRLLRGQPHTVLLYAHNDILRTVGHREALRSLDSTAAIVCVSKALAEITARRLPPSLVDRVHVVENGVDTVTFQPDARPRGPRVRIMFLGRMIPDKGADLLVKAAARLDRDDLEFVVVGSAGFDRDAPLTSYEQSLRHAAAGSRSPVVFERFVQRAAVPSLLQTADVFVVPSRWPDPSPLTVGEAMATGLPVVGSRIGGIPEVLGDAGVLIEPDDVEALALALDHLASDEGERARLSAAARTRAEDRSWSRTWSQLARLLDSAVVA